MANAASQKLAVLVTVGSTLFPALTNKVLSPSILSILPNLGVGRIIIQYGSGDLAALTDFEDIEVDIRTGTGEFVWTDYNGLGAVTCEVLRYTNDFEGLIARADIVISHAGSGSILTVLRMNPPKRLLVVPNTSLMDNHQAELAVALEKDGYLVTSSVEELDNVLPRFLKTAGQVQPFPGVQATRFRGVIDETMGFEP